MEENNSPKENIIIEKNNIDECQKKFDNHILDNINDFEKIKNNLIKLSLEGKTESELVRSFSYKIYLNTLSSNKDTTLKKWLQETLSQRNSYKEKIKRNNNMESSEDKGEKNENEENETRFQDINIFKEPTIKEIENNILFLFQNKNSKKILDMLIIALYPFYIKSDNNKNYNEELFEEWANEPKNNIKDIYNFFHDENEFESDLYYLMDNIMKLIINKFYEANNDKNKNYLSIRIQKIIDKLKIHNNKLYNHFKNIDFDINIILQKWLKNLFTEEFSPKNCITIWDSILANETKKSEELIYIDYFCISMLDCISEELLKKDKNDIEQRLLSYPFLENINILISLADKIKSKDNNTNIDKRKKNSSTTTGPGSMANFLYSTNKKNSQTKSVKTPNLMFGGDYSNKKGNTTLTPNVNQINNNKQVFPKKIPMFENIKNNSKNNNKTNSNINRPTFEFTKGYTVSNSENLKLLNELKGLIDIYIKEFSNDDKMKISFLIDNLSKEL